MKRLLILLVSMLLMSAPALGQSAATQNNAPAFDYLISDFTAASVTRFEIQFDGGAFTSIGVPATTDDTKTLAGGHTYAGPKFGTMGLSVGSHTFNARACNVGGCGGASPTPFAFTYAPIPAATANQRIQ